MIVDKDVGIIIKNLLLFLTLLLTLQKNIFDVYSDVYTNSMQSNCFRQNVATCVWSFRQNVATWVWSYPQATTLC